MTGTRTALADTRAEEDRVLRAAIELYGSDLQLTVLIEEMSELAKEICKHKRGKTNLLAIAEEAADVRIMLRQLEMLLRISGDVRMFEQAKIERLRGRMEREAQNE